MNQKELNELRRRFRLDKNNFSRVYGCYVNSNREIIAWVDTSMGLMRQEEQEMYLGLLKKSLSGTLGKNLIDVVFSTQQVADSDEHRLLQTLRQTELKDPASRETLCRQIIDCIDMGETNYLILLAADAYDAVYAVKAAMEACGKTPADADFTSAMVDAMYNITVDGLTGTMKWGTTREPDKNAKAMVFAADGTTSLLG